MFDVHTIDTAPAPAQDTLQAARKGMGMIPNLYGILAEEPAALNGYAAIAEAFASSSFTAAEQQVVILAVSTENGCEYCVAAHSTISKGKKLFGDATLAALRDQSPLPDAKLEALRQFAIAVVRERGWDGPEAVETCLAPGYERKHALAGLLESGLSSRTQ